VRGAPQALSSPRTALMHTASMGSLVSQSPSYTSPVMGTYCACCLSFPFTIFFFIYCHDSFVHSSKVCTLIKLIINRNLLGKSYSLYYFGLLIS